MLLACITKTQDQAHIKKTTGIKSKSWGRTESRSSKQPLQPCVELLPVPTKWTFADLAIDRTSFWTSEHISKTVLSILVFATCGTSKSWCT